MSISNNFLEKNLYLINFSEKKIYDLTLIAINILEKTDCILISRDSDKDLIKNLEKLNSELVYEEDLLKNKKISQGILELFKKYKSITHLRKFKEVFFNNRFMYDYLKLKRKVNIILVPTVKEVISTLNRLKIPLTDRRKNSSIHFIEDDIIKKLNLVLKDSYFEKVIIKIENQIQLEKIYGKLNKNNHSYNVIYLSSNKKLNQNNKNFKEEINLLFKKKETIYLILEKN